MNCLVCNTFIQTKPLQVKEMMFGTGKEYRYLQCQFCGCMQIEQIESDDQYLYPPSYYSFNTYKINVLSHYIKKTLINYSVAHALGYTSVLSKLLATSNRIMGAHALKGRINKRSKILDVGCGDGSLINALNWCGFNNLTGIDPFLKNNETNGRYKLIRCDINQMEDMAVFDIIMLHHSFEHTKNPHSVFKDIKRLLSKDGLCIIRIPVCDSYAFEHYHENWVQLDAPRHNFLHSNKSIQILAQNHGLQIEDIVNDSTEFQFIGSEQYKNGISLNHQNSYYVAPYKKFFYNKKHLFKSKDIKAFKRKAAQLNADGKGDQRIYYITHM